MKDLDPPEPRRVLQRFSEGKLAAFSRSSASDRLDWLEEIRWLYWEAERARRAGR